MTIITGLGNPGAEYEQTRHNVGFMVLDAVHKQLSLGQTLTKPTLKKSQAEIYKGKDVLLVKPQTYMNNSGLAVRTILDFYGLEDLKKLYVIHDDLDLEIGAYKIHFGKGPKIHNGLLSLYQHLKTPEFWHVRIGVDGRKGDRTLPGHMYVLQGFAPAEREALQTVIGEVTTKLLSCL